MKKKGYLKVKKVAFYNGGLVQPNEIIKNYKGEKIPSWATLLNGNETPRNSNKQKVADDANGKTGSVPETQTNNATKTEKVLLQVMVQVKLLKNVKQMQIDVTTLELIGKTFFLFH